jgi:predicted permease
MSRDDELDAELASHLRLGVEERMARGESREDAERAARREFGNVTHIKEVTREVRGLWLERLVQDVRYGVRALRRTPAFTIVAVLTLALAIGANSAVFTMVNSVLLKPLPFRDPERLFLASYVPIDLPFEIPPGMEYGAWLDYRQRTRAFEKLTAYRGMHKTLSGSGGDASDAATVAGARVDTSFFAVLGVSPVLGRSFVSEEALADRNTVAIISHRLWRERLGGDPRAIGTRIALDGVSHTVVGVMPAGFSFPAGSEIWTPLTMTLGKGDFFLLPVLGRLRDHVTVDQARAELGAIMAARPRGAQDDKWRALPAVLPLKDVITGKVAKSLLIFSGAVAFVLLIACVNVANLLLIRAATRRREIAVREALGASRARIGRQLLTESLLVGVAGGAVGIAMAQVGVRTLLAIAPAGRIPRLDEVHVDLGVLVFTIVLSLATGIIFGLVPALQSGRRPPADALAHNGRMVGATQGRLRGALVAAEVALALVLLTGAGLMIKSFTRMRGVEKGYDANRVTRMAVDLPGRESANVRYRDSARRRAFHSAMLEKLANIPGVRRAAAVSYVPMGEAMDGSIGNFVVDGPTPLPNGYDVDRVLLSPEYFATMGMRLLQGRDFTGSDDESAPAVAIVSETVARRVWPNADAVGKRIAMSERPGPNDWFTVVGVVNDVVQDRSLAKRSAIYVPYLQRSFPWLLGHMTYVVRSDAGVSVAPAMRAALRDVDAAIPAQQLQTMDDAMLEMVAEPLFQTRLLTVFSVMALLLAVIGTYGVLAYDVAERTREIALRLALGATPHAVTLMVLRRTARFALLGAVTGIAASLALTRVLRSSLFEVTANDPATLATVVVAILLVALAAGYLPARRASRVKVLTALQE